MSKKEGLKTVLFFILLIGVLSVLNHIYAMPYIEKRSLASTISRYNELYEEKENTWDGIILGRSVLDRAWVAPMAWNDYGMTLYPLSTDSQPIMLTKYIIEEVRKTQDIKLVVVEMQGIRKNALRVREVTIRRVTDNLAYSSNRIDAINAAFEYDLELRGKKSSIQKGGKWAYYVPFIKYHSRTDLNKYDFFHPVDDMKGVSQVASGAFVVKEQIPSVLTDVSGELSSLQREILMDIIEYGKENGVEIMFTAVPSCLDITEQEEINAAFDLVEEYGCKTLNFNTDEMYKSIGFDFATDMYNTNHMNSTGARKVTSLLSKFIHDNYSFEDKRGQEAYSSWNKAYEKYVNFYEEGWAKK